ncbi:MAG: DNA/RNA nuclease SfsA [Candidatus Parvarchaeota archaeon]
MVSFVKIEGELVRGLFKERVTRFSALIKIGNEETLCFLPNPGRLNELLVKDAYLILSKKPCGRRKTVYDRVAVLHNNQLISIDSRLPNLLVLSALKNRDLPEFAHYSKFKPEFKYGKTRFDFLLSNHGNPCILEVKSCTLVRSDIALFPDAPTSRGTRHVMELAKAVKESYAAAILFIIQRTDAKIFRPNDEIDPAFGKALREAVNAGVKVYAYSSEFIGDKLILKSKVQVAL